MVEGIMCVTMHKEDPAAAQIPAEVNPTRFHHPKKMSLVLDACGIVLFRRVLGKYWELRVPDADTRIGFRHMQGSLSGDCSGQTVPLPKWEAFEHTAVLEF